MKIYILKSDYGDLDTIALGSTLKQVTKSFKKFFEDQLEFPEFYNEDHIKKVNSFFAKEYKNVGEMLEQYEKNFDDDDYTLEELEY